MPSLPHGINRGVEIVVGTVITGIFVYFFYLLFSFVKIPMSDVRLLIIQILLALAALSLLVKMKYWSSKYIAGVLFVILIFLTFSWNNSYFLSTIDKIIFVSMIILGLWLILNRSL